MENPAYYAETARWHARREQELEEKYGKYRAIAKSYSLDSMRVLVDYTAVVVRVEFFKRGEEHIFIQTKTLPDRTGMEWDEVRESPYSIRDEFFRIRTVGQAIEFLQKTGDFSPLRQRLTWTEFQRWQRFARLVQEHHELSAAMRDRSWTGECAEVLKALTGVYPSSFFDGCEDGLYAHSQPEHDLTADSREAEKTSRDCRDATTHQEWLEAFEREKAELNAQHAQIGYERKELQRRRDLCQWFIRPPVRIEWHPINKEAEQRVLKLYKDASTGVEVPIPEESPIMRGGAMIEFLLSREQLTPWLVIRPQYALQAIAAAIYAERIQGITYRKCGWCGELFRIGGHKNKLYCDSPKPCQGNAQKQRQREKLRKEKERAVKKGRKSKVKSARRRV